MFIREETCKIRIKEEVDASVKLAKIECKIERLKEMEIAIRTGVHKLSLDEIGTEIKRLEIDREEEKDWLIHVQYQNKTGDFKYFLYGITPRKCPCKECKKGRGEMV